jgi:hypothetical protein
MGEADRKGAKKALSRRPISSDYEVGYRKPPVATQFAPGKSGNPRGRPKGSKNRKKLPALHEERLKDIILEEAYRTISVNDANGPVTIPMAQAVIRSLAVNAAKGNQRAQRLFAELLASVEGANRRLHDEWLETAINYKVEWERELERRNALGINAPEPVPHPNDIIVDMKTGLVQIKGPMTAEEKVVWDRARKRKEECDRTIAELEHLLEQKPDHPRRDAIANEIEVEKGMRAIISRAIPD